VDAIREHTWDQPMVNLWRLMGAPNFGLDLCAKLPSARLRMIPARGVFLGRPQDLVGIIAAEARLKLLPQAWQ